MNMKKQPLTKEEYDRVTTLSDIALDVIEKTMRYYVETLQDEVKKSGKSYLLNTSISEFIYNTSNVFPTRVLDFLEECGIFPEFERQGYKLKLMEQAMTKQMMLLEAVKDREELV